MLQSVLGILKNCVMGEIMTQDSIKWLEDIKTSKGKIRHLEKEISKLIASELSSESGEAIKPKDVRVTFGVEVEFFKVANDQSYFKRLRQIYRADREGKDLDELYKEKFLPKEARAKNMQKNVPKYFKVPEWLNTRPKLLQITKEPLYTHNIGNHVILEETEEGYFKKTGFEKVAYGQGELVTPPLRPSNIAPYLIQSINTLVHSAKDFGLKRFNFRTKPQSDVLTNSTHVNIVIGLRGKDEQGNPTFKNLFSRDDLNPEASENKDPTEISQLGLHISHKLLNFIDEAMLVLAPISNCYDRFSLQNPVGPNFNGFSPYRETGNYGTCMWRGAGRRCARRETHGTSEEKKDSGPLRLEARLNSNEALGHPNKKAYPEQAALCYEMIELYMHSIHEGLKSWIEQKKSNGTELTEQDLHEKKSELPIDVGEARDTFRESTLVKSIYADRIPRMLERYRELAKIIDLDNSPTAGTRGPQENRR